MTAVERVASSQSQSIFSPKQFAIGLVQELSSGPLARAQHSNFQCELSLSVRDDAGKVGELRLFSLRHKFNALYRRVECFSRETESRVIGCLFASLDSQQLYFYYVYYFTKCSGFLLDRADLLCVRFSLFHHLRLELEVATSRVNSLVEFQIFHNLVFLVFFLHLIAKCCCEFFAALSLLSHLLLLLACVPWDFQLFFFLRHIPMTTPMKEKLNEEIKMHFWRLTDIYIVGFDDDDDDGKQFALREKKNLHFMITISCNFVVSWCRSLNLLCIVKSLNRWCAIFILRHFLCKQTFHSLFSLSREFFGSTPIRRRSA